MKRMTYVFVLAVSATAVLAGCGSSDGDDSVAAGRQVFIANCAACHGQDLQGSATGPPLLHDYYKPSHHSDESFRSAIANGVQPHHWDFGPMPAFPNLSSDETEAVIAYIRSEQVAAGIE